MDPSAGQAPDDTDELQRLLSDSLTIANTLVANIEVNGRVSKSAFVEVDLERRPDVADMLRVHRLDGPEGAAETSWTFIPETTSVRLPKWAFLHVKVTRPVECSYSVAFGIAEHRAALEAILESEHVMVSLRPFRRTGDRTNVEGVSMPVSVEGLWAALGGGWTDL